MRPGSEPDNDRNGPRYDAQRGQTQPGWGGAAGHGQPLAGEQQFAGQPPFGGQERGAEQFAGQPPYGQPGPVPHTGASRVTRGRTGLVLLTSFLVQLIVVAAVGNQKVAESIAKFTARHSTTQSAFPRAALFYSWRFSPLGQDNFRLYPSQLLGLLTLFLVSAVLTFAVIRGPITFGRAFFGIWMAVIIAAVADGMVQRVVLKNYGQYGGYGNGGHKLFYAAFGGTGYDVMAGILLGLVVALVAALVAVISRRPAGPVSVAPFAPQPDAGPDTEAPPPYFGDDEPRRPSPDSEATRSLSMQKVHDSVRDEPTPERRPEPAAADSTSVLPRLESGDETTRLSRPPAPEDSAGQPPRRSERDQPTSQFPRPPDDEDLGHQPD